MKALNLCSPCVIVIILNAIFSIPTIASGQNSFDDSTWTVSRTPSGQPDLQGIWENNNATPLERPVELEDREFLNDEEVIELKERADTLFANNAGDAAFGDQVFSALITGTTKYETAGVDHETGNYNQFWVVERDFENDNRTSLITEPSDGRLPPITLKAQERLNLGKTLRERPAHGPEDRSLGERCITFFPRINAGYNSYFHILQTSGYVAILMEMGHDARIIPLDGRPHIKDKIRQWNGDSRGYWDGDTLVVDTTNHSNKSNFKGAGENLHLVERFTRTGPDRLHYEITVNDPTTWASSWTAMIPLKKTDDAIFEYACHEGNYGMFNLLSGARAEEQSSTRNER